jgi:uncharacterized protein (TIGR02246 family)
MDVLLERLSRAISLGFAAGLLLDPSPAAAQDRCDTIGGETAAVREVSAAIDRAFVAGDAAALAALVAEDAVWMPPDEPTLVGRAAVRTRYEELFRELHGRFRDVSHTLEVDEVRVCGDWAMSRGRYRLELSLPSVPRPIVITGKNVHSYRRAPRGTWLVSSDIWNADAPARRGLEAASARSADLQSLEAARAELRRALTEIDVEAADRIWADDYVLTTRNGVVRTKAYRLEWLAAGIPRYQGVREERDVHIRLYGDVALVTGRSDANVPRRFMAVWVREEGQEGRWRLVARQHTVVPPGL